MRVVTGASLGVATRAPVARRTHVTAAVSAAATQCVHAPWDPFACATIHAVIHPTGVWRGDTRDTCAYRASMSFHWADDVATSPCRRIG